ncbi:MAG TPA: FAD/NAD(P)-binding protein [Mucilaginibacter sp.]
MMSIADIAVIGSGAAATTTLIELFNKLIEGQTITEKLRIMVIDKYPEFWKGIPYGMRSSINSLTITNTADFVSVEQERKIFHEWLKANHDEWTRYYQLNGGVAASVWLANNLPLIEKDKWNEVYLPRFVFGWYMQNRLLTLLGQVEEKQLASITLIQAEAIAVKLNTDAVYEVTLEDGDKKTTYIKAQKIVIAIGSAPIKSNDDENSGLYAYINDLYAPTLDENLRTIKNDLHRTPANHNKNVLIIGSNASCIELLYILNHRPDILKDIHNITVISRTGKMPYYLSEAELEHYPCSNLDQLKQDGNYNVHTLVEATKKDISNAVQYTVIVVPYLNRIIGYTIELLQILDEGSKAIFFSIYGPQLTKLIRRSGPAYKSASDNLIALQKLSMLKGDFLNMEQGLNGGILNYINADYIQQKYPVAFKAVINCSGSGRLQNSASRLIGNLINQNGCGLTMSGEGIIVNEKFEAAPNLYVIGPLLAGNMNKIIHFWHLENVSRLIYLAPYLAEQLINN